MDGSAHDAHASNGSDRGPQKVMPNTGIAQEYMDAFELRLMTHIRELLNEQSKELTEVVLGNANRINRVRDEVVETMDQLEDQVKTVVSKFQMKKTCTFEGFMHDSSEIQTNPSSNIDIVASRASKLFRKASQTDQRLTMVMQAGNKSWLQKKTNGSTFRLMVVFLIMLQSLVLGWESNMLLSLEKERLEGIRSDVQLPKYFSSLEYVFMILFLLEWLARIVGWRKKFFRHTDTEWFAWNMFDTILVLSSFLIFFDVKMTWLRSIRLFRFARVLRIFRVAKKLRKMSYALIRAIDSMLWLMVLLSLMLYIFSLVVMRAAYLYMQDFETAQYQSLESGDPDTQQDMSIILDRFGSLPSTMISLLATFTGGAEWDSLFKPIMSVSPLYAIVVVFFVILFVFAVMNVVTGVFVEDAMKIAQTDESVAIADAAESELAFEKAVKRLMSIIDADNDGLLTGDQLLEALKKKSVQQWLAIRDIDLSAENARRIMHIFQDHMSGSFDAKVLKSFLQKVRGQARRTDLIVAAHDLRVGQKELQRSLETVDKCYKQIAELDSRMKGSFDYSKQHTHTPSNGDSLKAWL